MGDQSFVKIQQNKENEDVFIDDKEVIVSFEGYAS